MRSSTSSLRWTIDTGHRTSGRRSIIGPPQILNEEVPTIFWWSENMIWGLSKKLQGVIPGPNTDIHWNIQEWWLSE